MLQDQNVKVVQDAYAAFGRGDIDAMLNLIDDGVVWNGVYGAGAHVPMSGERRGKAQVREFFNQVSRNVKFSRFEPQQFIASDDKVVTLGHYTSTTPTGKTFDADFAMVFTLRNGKVTAFQEFTNSAGLDAAFR